MSTTEHTANLKEWSVSYTLSGCSRRSPSYIDINISVVHAVCISLRSTITAHCTNGVVAIGSSILQNVVVDEVHCTLDGQCSLLLVRAVIPLAVAVSRETSCEELLDTSCAVNLDIYRSVVVAVCERTRIAITHTCSLQTADNHVCHSAYIAWLNGYCAIVVGVRYITLRSTTKYTCNVECTTCTCYVDITVVVDVVTLVDVVTIAIVHTW